jgi:MscS family membrane protein
MTPFLRTLVLAIGLLCHGQGGATGLLAELDASSPAATLSSFHAETKRVEALYETYNAAPTTVTQFAMAEALQRIGAQLFDLSEIPHATRHKAGNAIVGYLADILLRLPEIPLESVPGGASGPRGDLPPHWTIPGTEIRMVRLSEGPRSGDYVFSAATVARLPQIHAQAEGLPALRPSALGDWATVQQRTVGPWLMRLPLERLPASLQATMLGTPIWKVLFSGLIAATIVAFVLGWRSLVGRWTRTGSAWRRYALRLTVPVLLGVLVVLGHGFIAWQVVPSSEIARAETLVATLALYVAAAWAAWCACWLSAEAVIASPTFPDDTFDAHLLRIVARVGSLVAAGGILLYGANDIGVPGVGLLAGVSIGGIALALAAQSTVENLLGGVTLFADRPFRVGDQIRFGSGSGTVESIGPRSTRIRGADGTLTSVPNADLAKTQLVNVSARPNCTFQHKVALPSGLSSAQIEALLAELRRRVGAHPLVEIAHDLPRVRLVGLGAGARNVEIEVFARILTTSTPEFLQAQEALLLDILRGAEACGVDLAEPAAAGDMPA